jgi:acetylornithine/N-succinyldiaminopimelate aminotransferase
MSEQTTGAEPTTGSHPSTGSQPSTVPEPVDETKPTWHHAPPPDEVTPWAERFSASMMRSSPPPLAMLVRGEGAWVEDSTGKRYLDFLAGIAVNSLGHAHPALVEAVSRQIATLAHVSNYFASPSQIELAERLRRLSGAGDAGRVYFGNSGAEANEAAFKLARRNNESGRRTRILTLKGSFHGRTMGALALTGQPDMQAPFLPLPGGVEHIEASIEALEASIDDTVAAVMFEPIKGEAGVVEHPEGFLERARELTRQHGALLILDEIQTGIGRTGRWFAFQHYGIEPDVITVAKGIAGGVPLGAMVTFERASDLLQKGQHGSTFGGNPLATTAGNAVLGEIESAGLVENAERRGEQLREVIHGLGSPLVREVRGRGLLLGLGLAEPVAARVASAAMQEGLIVNAPNPASIRIAPPLIIGNAEVAEFGARFGRALGHLDAGKR